MMPIAEDAIAGNMRHRCWKSSKLRLKEALHLYASIQLRLNKLEVRLQVSSCVMCLPHFASSSQCQTGGVQPLNPL